MCPLQLPGVGNGRSTGIVVLTETVRRGRPADGRGLAAVDVLYPEGWSSGQKQGSGCGRASGPATALVAVVGAADPVARHHRHADQMTKDVLLICVRYLITAFPSLPLAHAVRYA